MSIKVKMLAMLAAIASVGGLVFATQSQAVYVDTTPDCDKYAVIHCGAKDLSVLRTEYDSLNKNSTNGSTTEQRDIPAIFSAMGISRSDLEGRNSQFTFGEVYKDGRVVVNGKTVATNAMIAGRNMGGTPIRGSANAGIVPASKMGSAQRAIVKFNYDGQFLFAVMTPCGNPVKATNVVPKPKQPVYACVQLTQREISRTEREFTAKLTAQDGAVISGYIFNFGDGTSKTVGANSSTIRHSYAQPGTYTATVTGQFTANGKTVTATAPACKVTVTIEPEPAKPVYRCDALYHKQISRTEHEFNSKITAANGATVASRTFSFGDGNTRTVSATGPITHTYAKPGTYTVKLTANISVDGKTVQATSAACETQVTVKEADKPGVAIVKTVNGVEHEVVDVDEVFNYEVKVMNTGNVTLKNAVVTDNAPEGVTFKSADKGSIADNKWTYTIPEIAAGASVMFNIKAVVTEYQPGVIENTACVETPTVPGEKPCDDATVEVPEPLVERCDLTTNTIVKDIPLSQADDERYTKDYSQCEDVKVCDVTTGEIITVAKHEADNPNYDDVDSEKCKPVVTTPEKLPTTGLSDSISAVLGLGSLTMATYYYVASRRN